MVQMGVPAQRNVSKTFVFAFLGALLTLAVGLFGFANIALAEGDDAAAETTADAAADTKYKPITVDLVVRQCMDNRVWTDDDKFTYGATLMEEASGITFENSEITITNKMPSYVSSTYGTRKHYEGHEGAIAATITELGTYYVLIEPVARPEWSMTYTPNSIKCQITVTEDNGSLIATVQYFNEISGLREGYHAWSKTACDESEVEFRGFYYPDYIIASIPVSKELVGREWEEGETFNFKIFETSWYESSGTNPGIIIQLPQSYGTPNNSSSTSDSSASTTTTDTSANSQKRASAFRSVSLSAVEDSSSNDVDDSSSNVSDAIDAYGVGSPETNVDGSTILVDEVDVAESSTEYFKVKFESNYSTERTFIIAENISAAESGMSYASPVYVRLVWGEDYTYTLYYNYTTSDPDADGWTTEAPVFVNNYVDVDKSDESESDKPSSDESDKTNVPDPEESFIEKPAEDVVKENGDDSTTTSDEEKSDDKSNTPAEGTGSEDQKSEDPKAEDGDDKADDTTPAADPNAGDKKDDTEPAATEGENTDNADDTAKPTDNGTTNTNKKVTAAMTTKSASSTPKTGDPASLLLAGSLATGGAAMAGIAYLVGGKRKRK